MAREYASVYGGGNARMLVVKVFVNFDQIDEVHLQNTGKSRSTIYHMYRIVKPEGYDNFLIDHDRSEGYTPLVKSVFEILTQQGHKTEAAKEWEKELKAKKKKKRVPKKT